MSLVFISWLLDHFRFTSLSFYKLLLSFLGFFSLLQSLSLYFFTILSLWMSMSSSISLCLCLLFITVKLSYSLWLLLSLSVAFSLSICCLFCPSLLFTSSSWSGLTFPQPVSSKGSLLAWISVCPSPVAATFLFTFSRPPLESRLCCSSSNISCLVFKQVSPLSLKIDLKWKTPK